MSYRSAALMLVVAASLVSSSSAKPRLTVAADGFPTGQATPEGAASDLARAFIRRDAVLFRNICVRPYASGGALSDYTDYLRGVLDHLQHQGRSTSGDEPKKIVRLFAARHLNKIGPASYGYASFGFQDVMFVDLEVLLQNGSKLQRRTLVIKDRDGRWYAHPVPDVSPLLSDGLYDESPSVKAFGAR